MKVSELIKQLTDNASPEADVHILCDEGTYIVTNILVSAACDPKASVKEADVILASFTMEE